MKHRILWSLFGLLGLSSVILCGCTKGESPALSVSHLGTWQNTFGHYDQYLETITFTEDSMKWIFPVDENDIETTLNYYEWEVLETGVVKYNSQYTNLDWSQDFIVYIADDNQSLRIVREQINGPSLIREMDRVE